MIMIDKTILCKICNIIFKCDGFSSHLNRIHNIKFKNYVKNNIDDFYKFGWKWCDNCKIEPVKYNPSYKKYNRKFTTCSRKCAIEYRSNMWKLLGHPNKNMKRSDASKEKMRIKRQQYCKTHTLKHSDETKKKLSKLAIERLNENSKSFKISKLEVEVKSFLLEHKYDIIHQFYIRKDSESSYFYDFKLKKYPIIIEVDGDYWHGGPGCKIPFSDVETNKMRDTDKTLVANASGYNLIRIWESEFKATPNVLIERINNMIYELAL